MTGALLGVVLVLVPGALAESPGEATALVAADFDGDGVDDLVIGRSAGEGGFLTLHRGNVDAIFPHTPQARRRKLEGTFTDAPFIGPPRTVGVPVRPDLLVAGDFNRDGHADVAATSGDGGPSYLFPGDGRGGWLEPRAWPHAVTVAAGKPDGYADAIAAVSMRLNEDAVPDVVMLRQGKPPSVALSAPLATITVNSAADGTVAGDGDCTLREAIGNANANADSTGGDCVAGSGADMIVFDIDGGGAAVTIDIASALPFLSDPVTINGNTQGCPTSPCVDLNGIPSLSADGLRLTGGSTTVRGLVIRGFDEQGVFVDSDGNFIEGNFIGTDLGGNIPFPNSMAGVYIDNASNNTVGGATVAARNLLSANTDGVNIPGGSMNAVLGNRIGTNAAGTADLGNAVWGIFVGGSDNTIGAAAAGAGNLVSGNNFAGIGINGIPATGNRVSGNRVGLDASGSFALPNESAGLILTNGASENTIGGTAAGEGNVISGNDELGIAVGTGATLNAIEGNYVGTDASGSFAVGNLFSGILIQDAEGNTIGSTALGAGNLISGNGQNGVFLVDTDGPAGGTAVLGNRIGLDAAGTAAVPNALNGIRILDSANNTIGGTDPAAGNLIFGNTRYGIELAGSDCTGNDVLGNRILEQGRTGVQIDGAEANRIGGTIEGAGNLISGSGRLGVAVVAGTGNAILGNSIFDSSLLGIGLGSDGVTANDAGDADGGANDLQNYPELTSADATASAITIGGTLMSQAGTAYRVEFFAGTSCDASGHGEGERLLGSVEVTTDPTGIATFSEVLAAPVSDGDSITATATDPLDNTSEFSQCLEATCPATVVFGQTVFASDPATFVWQDPSDVRFAKGDLAAVSTYSTTDAGVLLGAAAIAVSTDDPGPGAGLYYLVRPLGCGSWQTSSGSEPDRDLFLP